MSTTITTQATVTAAAEVTVYTKPSCVQCNATYRSLDKKGIDYKVVDLTEDPDLLVQMRERDLMQAPVVILTTPDGAELDVWTGFRPDKISEHAEAMSRS